MKGHFEPVIFYLWQLYHTHIMWEVKSCLFLFYLQTRQS